MILVQWSSAGSGGQVAELRLLSDSAAQLQAHVNALHASLRQLPAADAAVHGLPACGACLCAPPPAILMREPAPPCAAGSSVGARAPLDEPDQPLRAGDPMLCAVVKTTAAQADSSLRPMLLSLLTHRPSNLLVFLMDPDPADYTNAHHLLLDVAHHTNKLLNRSYAFVLLFAPPEF